MLSNACLAVPHEFVQVWRLLVALTSFQLALHPAPVNFDVFCVHICHRILEMQGVIDSVVAGHSVLTLLNTLHWSLQIWNRGNKVVASICATTHVTPRAGLWEVSTSPNTHTGDAPSDQKESTILHTLSYHAFTTFGWIGPVPPNLKSS